MDTHENMEDTHTVLRMLIIFVLEFCPIWVCIHSVYIHIYIVFMYTSIHIYTYTYANIYIYIYSKQFQYSFHFYCMCMCVCVHESVPTCFFRHICTHVYPITPVEVREQLLGISSFLSLCQSWGLNARHQSWQQMPFADKSLCWSYKCNSWCLDDIFGYFPCLTTNMMAYL